MPRGECHPHADALQTRNGAWKAAKRREEIDSAEDTFFVDGQSALCVLGGEQGRDGERERLKRERETGEENEDIKKGCGSEWE